MGRNSEWAETATEHRHIVSYSVLEQAESICKEQAGDHLKQALNTGQEYAGRKTHRIVSHVAEHNPAESESKSGDELHVRLIGGHGWRRERQTGRHDPAGRVY